MKQVYTSLCFSTDFSTSLRNTNMEVTVLLSGMKPYCTGAISSKVLPLNLLITIRSTNLVTRLIKLIVRCFLHLIVPFTLGSVINIYLLSSLGKLPWLCIMFHNSVSSNIPTSPGATSISVVILAHSYSLK